ncbi:MAG: hypothetical protein FJ382_06675 [Verrucomicrobia bacterium]|nr:hypothetical protein [Verrucomicrobiota bacterium]
MTSPLSFHLMLPQLLAGLLPLLLAPATPAAVPAPAALPAPHDLSPTPDHPRSTEGAFLTLRSGRIIFQYSQFREGQHDHSPSAIAEIHSDDGGRTWSEPRVVVPTGSYQNIMSVSLLRLASGRIARFHAVKTNKWLSCQIVLSYSDDEGATWTAPRQITAAPGYFVLNNDRVIQTRSGRLIVPLGYHRTRGTADERDSWDARAIALWIFSDDEGRTWREADTWWTLPVASGSGLQEPGLVELSDGLLYTWCRTDQGEQWSLLSRDEGRTWSAPQPTTLRSPTSPASLKFIPGTRTLLALYNDHSGALPRPQGRERRAPLAAAFSTDGAQSWSAPQVIEPDLTGWYCYTSIHFTEDAVLLGYVAGNDQIGHLSRLRVRRVPFSWLQVPIDATHVRGRVILREIQDADETWVKIHAAEARIVGGEAAAVRREFLALAARADAYPYRVGIWRVLAGTAPTPADRAAAVAEVVKIFVTPASPDRSQALETLGKLGVRLEGEALSAARQIAASGPEGLRGLAFWALRNSGEPQALEQLCGLLRSPNETQRLIAAYALRWIKETDAGALRQLAAAAAAEPASSAAHPYLQSAAYALHADPARHEAWRARLFAVLEQGTVAARWEACNGLLSQARPEDLPRYLPLLDDPESDARIGAAMTFLHLAAPPRT